ncbi:MAG: 30S ribosomal protein S24e [Candidatus Brockarchaeota archaeon]|nr:30S ribosomal protein S24e [Candidatus Brockarchaeota archaeon]
MSLRVLEERTNPLVRRREVAFEVEHPGSPTPAVASIKERLVALLNSKPEATYVVSLGSLRGLQRSRGLCHVYLSPSDGKAFEPEHVQRLNLQPEERAKALENLKKSRSSRKAGGRVKGR